MSLSLPPSIDGTTEALPHQLTLEEEEAPCALEHHCPIGTRTTPSGAGSSKSTLTSYDGVPSIAAVSDAYTGTTTRYRPAGAVCSVWHVHPLAVSPNV